MNFIKKEINDITIISINVPKATTENSKEFKNYLIESISVGGKKKIIINFLAVDFVDSSFLGALITGLKSVMSIKGDIKILSLQPAVRAMFELTRIYRVFEIFDNEQDALDSF